MTRALTLFCSVLVCTGAGLADTGVIIPTGKDAPDDSILSIESMEVHIVIDNGHATVALKEIFRNKTLTNLEGTYSLALPNSAAVSDFAVWDDLTRIPGVILERKRAQELYNEIRNQMIDPGLLNPEKSPKATRPAKRATPPSSPSISSPSPLAAISASKPSTARTCPSRNSPAILSFLSSLPRPKRLCRQSLRLDRGPKRAAH